MLSQGYFWQETAKYKELVEIDGELFFTATADEWFEETAVTLEQQMKARDILKKSGIWIEDKCGIPARLYYRIDFEQLVLFIAKYLESRKQGLGKAQNKELAKPKTVDGENPKQDVGFPQNYIIDDESFFESLESSIVANAPTENQTVFSVEIFEPSKTEILTLETEKTPPPQIAPAPPAPRRAKDSRTAEQIAQVVEIVDYLNAKAGTKYRANTGDTAKSVCGRMAEGYTIEEIKRVIDHKCREWLGTDMQRFLCPATLFRPANFEKYYNVCNMPAPKNLQPKQQTAGPAMIEGVKRFGL